MHVQLSDADLELGRSRWVPSVPDWAGILGILVCATDELRLPEAAGVKDHLSR